MLPIALVFSVVAASAAPPSAGLVEVRPDGARTLFTTQRWSRNDRVVAQYAEAQGNAKCCVALRILGTQRRRTDVSDELQGRRVRAYVLPSLRAADAVPFVGSALVFKVKERIPGEVEGALQGDEIGSMLPNVCTSSEGAHLLQWGEGKPQAHLYMHFNYDVEPSCSEESLKKFY